MVLRAQGPRGITPSVTITVTSGAESPANSERDLSATESGFGRNEMNGQRNSCGHLEEGVDSDHIPMNNHDDDPRSTSVGSQRMTFVELLKAYAQTDETDRQDRSRDIATMSLDDIAEELATGAAEVARGQVLIEKTSRVVARHAWRCGKLLNQAKRLVKKGDDNFGDWLWENWEEVSGMSASTARRYMKLARKFKSVEELLSNGDGLREIYRSLGWSEPKEAAETKVGTLDPKETAINEAFLKVDLLVTVVRRMKKRMKNSAFTEEQRKKVADAKAKVDEVFAELLRSEPSVACESP